MTEPFYKPSRILTQKVAVSIYSDATKIDAIAGSYPPNDTGSTGLAACKAAHNAGLLHAYRHAFGLTTSLQILSFSGPFMLGINWYEGFDQPAGVNDEIKISGSIRGGHEIEVLAIDVLTKTVLLCNSWGLNYGNKGYVTMSFDTLARLLSEQGDVMQPEL